MTFVPDSPLPEHHEVVLDQHEEHSQRWQLARLALAAFDAAVAELAKLGHQVKFAIDPPAESPVTSAPPTAPTLAIENPGTEGLAPSEPPTQAPDEGALPPAPAPGASEGAL